MTDMPISARVGANVRRYRTERGLSLRQLGDRLRAAGLDLSVSGLSRLEQGQRGLTVDALIQLADALDVPPVDLLEQETQIMGTGNLSAHLIETPAHGLALHAALQRAGQDQPAEPAVAHAVDRLAAAAKLRGLAELLRLADSELGGAIAPLIRAALLDDPPDGGDADLG